MEFENTNALGKGKRYARFKVPGNPYMYPAYDLNHAYEETDVFVSMAKLKNHATCGVTLSIKNCFGTLPASIYGDDAGVDEPNESPTDGPRQAWATKGAASPRNPRRRSCTSAPTTTPATACRTSWPTWRRRAPSTWPSSTAWNPSRAAKARGSAALRMVKPGVLIAGLNPVCTDAVADRRDGLQPARRRAAPRRSRPATTRCCWPKPTAWEPPT